MKKRFVNVALCQRNSAGDPQHNLEASAEMIRRAVKGRGDTDLVVLPEYNDFYPAGRDVMLEYARPFDGIYVKTMCDLAAELKVNLVPGSFTCLLPNGRMQNTTLFIDREGTVRGKYAKIHLMKALGTDESKYSEAGNELCILDTDIGTVGLLLCYDIRFPELARSLVVGGAEILVCAACFPVGRPLPPRTGHWDTLINAMALQNLTWVCAVNQYGQPAPKAFPFGRSMVVNPWGTVVARANDMEDIVYATLDLEYQQEILESVGGLKNRRPDVYRL